MLPFASVTVRARSSLLLKGNDKIGFLVGCNLKGYEASFAVSDGAYFVRKDFLSGPEISDGRFCIRSKFGNRGPLILFSRSTCPPVVIA